MPPTTTTVVASSVAAAGWDPSHFIALLALVVAMVVPALTFRHDHRLRREERVEARRREAALILGPAFAMVHDFNQAALDELETLDDAATLLARIEKLMERHDREVRPALMAMTAAFPFPEGEAAGRLLSAMENLPRTAIKLIKARRGGEGETPEGRERYEAVEQAREEALAAVGALGRLLRAEG